MNSSAIHDTGDLYAGIGLRSAADRDTVITAIDRTLSELGPGGATLRVLATHPARQHHPALLAAGAHLAVPLLVPDVDDVKRQTTLTASSVVKDRLHVGSVAEAAALAACHQNHKRCRLLAARLIDPSRLVTVALATPVSIDVVVEDMS